VITDNHYLRDYHRSAEKQQQQTVGVVAGNAKPPIAARPEVRQGNQPMAPPALQQSQLQQQPNGGDVGFVSVSSRKHRYLCEWMITAAHIIIIIIITLHTITFDKF